MSVINNESVDNKYINNVTGSKNQDKHLINIAKSAEVLNIIIIGLIILNVVYKSFQLIVK